MRKRENEHDDRLNIAAYSTALPERYDDLHCAPSSIFITSGRIYSPSNLSLLYLALGPEHDARHSLECACAHSCL